MMIARLVRTLLGRGPDEPASYAEVERAEQRFYIDYLREGMTVFDVGANVGELSLLFSRFVGASGCVHAFEASGGVYADLRTVLDATGRTNVVANALALSDVAGQVELHCYDGPFRSFNSFADRPLARYGVDAGERHVESVPATTVDAYCKDHGIERIDLLKVDVEGAELQVLRGAIRMLRERRVGCVTFEFGQTTFDMGNSPAAIEALFDDVGYLLTNIVAADPPFPGRESVTSARFAMMVARPG